MKKFIHSRPENHGLKTVDEEWPLSISLRETAGFSLRSFICIVVSLFLIVAVNGCSVRIFRGHPEDLDKISELREKVKALEEAKALLEQRLKDEIKGKQVKVEMTKRGLVITFLNEVLFDSGKAVLRKEAYPILDKVVGVIKEKVSDRYIGIEGHTDNQPIKYSGWKSNWELSTARATSVLHYLEDSGIDSTKLQATGFGEHRPVASNKTDKGRQENRRVEIVILPGEISRITYERVVPPGEEDISQPEIK